MQKIKLVNGYPFQQLSNKPVDKEDCLKHTKDFLELMQKRRSIRHFAEIPVPKDTIENILAVANTAPSGANKQPWTFCAIQNKELKAQIRKAAEEEEYKNYNGRMPEEWLNDLKPFQIDWHKEFLETAPWLIVIFKKSYDTDAGNKKTNYYVQESVGIAAGFLIAAIHAAGLVTLTHTPSPMNFLSRLLKRPANEKAFLVLPVGYPAEKCLVPYLKKKALNEVAIWFE